MNGGQLPAIGGYVLEAKLGEGGMGAVYRATNPRFPGRAFALKLFATEEKPSPEQVARFQREMHALAAAIAHPNVVRLFGGTVEGDRPYVVMELVAGPSLAKLVKEEGPLEPARAVKLVRAVTDALAHVHESGVVHRDLKPENVLVEAGDRPRVCDFGLAKVAGAERLTRSGTFVGTRAWASPEQVDGLGHAVDARADVYALGALLSFTLTGKPPFEAASEGELSKKILFETPRAPSRAVASVPPALDAVCLKALEKEPALRYGSAAELRDELDRFLADEPVLARTPTATERARRWLRRRRRELALVALGLAVVAGALGVAHARRQAALRREDLALETALAPGKSSTEIAANLVDLETMKAAPAKIARARGRLDEVRYEEAAAKLPRGATRADLLDLAKLALRAPGAVSLVGERPGLALGEELLRARADALLEREDLLEAARERLYFDWATVTRKLDELDAEAAAVVAAARELATAGAARPGDAGLAGCALRALVELAIAGAPLRPLAGGRLAASGLVERVRADLAAARAAPGEPGERAAWLLVDLLAVEPPARQKDAEEALAAAIARAPAAECRAPLEALVRADRSGADAVALLAASIGEKDDARVRLLARMLARCGAPRALDALDAGGSTIERALARDPRDELVAVVSRANDGPARAKEHARRARELATKIRSKPQDVLAQIEERDARTNREGSFENVKRRLARHGRELDEHLEAGLALAPWNRDLLHAASRTWRKGPVTTLFLAVRVPWERDTLHELAKRFDPEDRAMTDVAIFDELFDERWKWSEDPPGRAAIEAFDRALEGELASDPAVRGLRAGHADDLVAHGAAVTRALRRIELLGTRGARLDPTERARTAVEAFRDLEPLDDLAGPGAHAVRARLRRLALPAPWGELEATVSLRRVLRAGELHAAWEDDLGKTLLFAMHAATEEPPRSDPAQRVGEQLYRLGVTTIVAKRAWRAATTKNAERDTVREVAFIAGEVWDFWHYLRPGPGLPRDRYDKDDVKITPALERAMRSRAAKRIEAGLDPEDASLVFEKR